MLTEQTPPTVATGMLIRKPVNEVFRAFIDPAITTRFWFTAGTGRLEQGKQVEWHWSMYNHTAIVQVREIIQDKKIEITWGAKGSASARVEWTFESYPNGSTFVNITSDGFLGDAQAILKQVADNVGGFCWVLAGCKAWLEFGIQLNLVADRYPGGK
jgi:uncharacterized protein YndB with AHSA1/START domain